MCGIYGIVNYKKNGYTTTDLKKMGDVLKNRGPDDRGQYEDDMVILGHNRLSILDLSPMGHQPMSNLSQDIWITFNGEIYNYQELKKQLSKKYTFKSSSDTEVVIYAYQEYGEKAWTLFEGMFAFGLWDKRNNKFFLVRDHYGIKPLYYSYLNGSLIFASQLKAILETNKFPRNYNKQSVSNYFSYFYVPGPETIIDQINQVEPAQSICFKDNNLQFTKYYNPSFQAIEKNNEEEIIYKTPIQLSKAVEKSLVSDVPVGLLLSGGMDSNSILCEMSKLVSYKIKSYTLGVKDKSHDEGIFAKSSAKYWKTEHYLKDLDVSNIESQLNTIVEAVDCLNANPGILMMLQYFQLASTKSKVVLIGSGADELLAGYKTYVADIYYKWAKIIPAKFLKGISKAVAYLPVKHTKYSFDYVAKKFFEGIMFDPIKAHYWWRTIFTDDEKKKLLNINYFQNVNLDSSYKYREIMNAINASFEDKAMYADFNLFLIDNALVLADHLSMHYSLEARPPFLYQRLVEFFQNIPYSLKLKNKQTKYILRKAYKSLLDPKTIGRKKLGVVAPLGLLINNEWKEYTKAVLAKAHKLNFINQNYIDELLEEHVKFKKDNGFKIWTIICLIKWHERYME